jgi:CPA2 family monovalent cation:H+ antiporter-2
VDETRFLADLGLLFLAAFGGAAVAQLLRQPLIVGYVLGGIVVGPFTPGPTIENVHTFEQFAEIGVILLMFTIGTEFSFRELLHVGRLALLGGPLGIVLVTGITVGVGWLLGWGVVQSTVVGAALSVASTMVLMKFLVERGELGSPHGQAVVGITLVEDLAVVVMTLLIPALGSSGKGHLLLILRGLLLSALMLVPVVWLAGYAVPRVLAWVGRDGNEELLLLGSVTIAVATAALTVVLGLSHALGAFLGGMMIGGSEPARRAGERVLPLRDVFVAVFFVSVGMLVRPAALVGEIPAIVAMVLLVTVGKFLVWLGIVRVAGYATGTAVLAALGLTQVGEFSYILGKAGVDHGLVSRPVYDAILGTSLLTILWNALSFRRWRVGRESTAPSP